MEPAAIKTTLAWGWVLLLIGVFFIATIIDFVKFWRDPTGHCPSLFIVVVAVVIFTLTMASLAWILR